MEKRQVLSSEEIDVKITGITVITPESTGSDKSNELNENKLQTKLGPNDESIDTKGKMRKLIF